MTASDSPVQEVWDYFATWDGRTSGKHVKTLATKPHHADLKGPSINYDRVNMYIMTKTTEIHEIDTFLFKYLVIIWMERLQPCWFSSGQSGRVDYLAATKEHSCQMWCSCITLFTPLFPLSAQSRIWRSGWQKGKLPRPLHGKACWHNVSLGCSLESWLWYCLHRTVTSPLAEPHNTCMTPPQGQACSYLHNPPMELILQMSSWGLWAVCVTGMACTQHASGFLLDLAARVWMDDGHFLAEVTVNSLVRWCYFRWVLTLKAFSLHGGAYTGHQRREWHRQSSDMYKNLRIEPEECVGNTLVVMDLLGEEQKAEVDGQLEGEGT